MLEAAPELTELGVGINLLPHATRSLSRLGLLDALARVAVTTKESMFFTRHGQLIYREPAARPPGTRGRSSPFTAATCSGCSSAAVRGPARRRRHPARPPGDR